MAKLNDTQLMILSAASQRRDFSVYPLPKSVKTGDGPKHLKKLLALQMVEESEAIGDAPVWREHEDGYAVTLVLADEGFRTLGVEREETRVARKKQQTKKSTQMQCAEVSDVPRRGSKQAILIALLQRPEGVSLDELAGATGWQRHSVHGVMSGVLKKKLGLAILSERGTRGRTYRIVASE